MKPILKKITSVSLIPIVLIAVFVASSVVVSFAMPSASGYTSRINGTNTQHNWSGGGGVPTSWSPTTCEAGSCNVYYNFTLYDRNNAENVEDMVEGGMNPVNHTIWIHINNTANTSYIRNFTGGSGFGANAVFTVTRADITDYGKINVSYQFAVPSGWSAGRYYTNFNATDNATTFTSSEIWHNSSYILVTGEGITEELLDGGGVDQNINAGTWGNVTVTPGDTNSEWNVNYLRVENTGSYPTQQFTVSFTPTTWSSADTGDSIAIDTNIEWAFANTNYSGDNPDNNFVSEGATWSSWLTDTSGLHEFRFWATGEYSWVKIRVLAIPSPLSGADDYEAAYTVTASGTV